MKKAIEAQREAGLQRKAEIAEDNKRKREFEEWEGPEPSGCLAAGWGKPIRQSPAKRQREEEFEDNSVFGSTGGAGHGHGGPGL